MVCMGTGCRAQFFDVSFEGCTLVALDGAHVTLTRAQFVAADSLSHKVRLSVYAHGTGTTVSVEGRGIHGGCCGVTVQAGAHIQASDLVIDGVWGIGAEVHGDGSELRLTRCRLHAHPGSQMALEETCWVYVHDNATARLAEVAVSGMTRGVRVERGSTAHLSECSVYDTEESCVVFNSGSTGHLDNCKLSASMYRYGLCIADGGSVVKATCCKFVNCGNHGVYVCNEGKLVAKSCESHGNEEAGFSAEEGMLELQHCSGDGNTLGCSVTEGGALFADKLVIRNCAGDGVRMLNNSRSEMRDCTVQGCADSGVSVRSVGAAWPVQLALARCTLEWNAGGLKASGEDVVVAVGECCSRGNEAQGYLAEREARMTVRNSCSDGDLQGFLCMGGARLALEQLTVDGTAHNSTAVPNGRPLV